MTLGVRREHVAVGDAHPQTVNLAGRRDRGDRSSSAPSCWSAVRAAGTIGDRLAHRPVGEARRARPCACRSTRAACISSPGRAATRSGGALPPRKRGREPTLRPAGQPQSTRHREEASERQAARRVHRATRRSVLAAASALALDMVAGPARGAADERPKPATCSCRSMAPTRFALTPADMRARKATGPAWPMDPRQRVCNGSRSTRCWCCASTRRRSREIPGPRGRRVLAYSAICPPCGLRVTDGARSEDHRMPVPRVALQSARSRRVIDGPTPRPLADCR